jgi:cytochrome P450
MAHSFSVASLNQMEHIFDRHIRNLLNTIGQRCKDEPFDLKELLAYYTYDVMGELIFNADFEAQKTQDPEQLPPINEHIFLGCLYGMLPSLLPYSMRLSKYIPWSWLQHLLRSRKTLRDKTAYHVKQEMQREKQGIEARQTILQRLMQAIDPDTGERLTEEQIDSEAFAFLVAGSHTTSGSLTLLFYHLLHNSAAMTSLAHELEAHFSKLDETTEPSLPAYAGLEARLPYMTACIRESLRVSPVFTMPLPRTVCNPEGIIINGIHVPPKVGLRVFFFSHCLLMQPFRPMSA